MISVSLIINISIFLLVLFSVITMYCGIDFMKKEGVLEVQGKEMFRFFTIDSNVLMGLCSLIMAFYEFLFLTGKIEILPTFIFTIKLMGTSAVMLTFLVTIFFLVPQYKNPKVLFYNSNFFFHLIVPILACISFVFFEKTNTIHFVYTLYGILPTFIYAIYYVIEIYCHLDHGKVSKHYDFYNFTFGNIKLMPISASVVLLISYLITLSLWILN